MDISDEQYGRSVGRDSIHSVSRLIMGHSDVEGMVTNGGVALQKIVLSNTQKLAQKFHMSTLDVKTFRFSETDFFTLLDDHSA